MDFLEIIIKYVDTPESLKEDIRRFIQDTRRDNQRAENREDSVE